MALTRLESDGHGRHKIFVSAFHRYYLLYSEPSSELSDPSQGCLLSQRSSAQL